MSQLLISLFVLSVIMLAKVEAQTAVTTPNCKDGFWWDGQKCDICGTGCRTCTATGKCTDCLEGRYMSGDMCMSCGIDGVKTCCAAGNDANAIRALTCNDGYTLEGSVCVKNDGWCEKRITNTYVCEKCKDMYYMDEYNVCVQGTVTGCKTYTNKENCKVCQDGYYMAKKTDANNRFYWGCDKCDDNCKCSEEKNKCTSCWDGAFYQSSAADAATKTCAKCPLKEGANIVASLKCDAQGCLMTGGCPSNALCVADGNDNICRTLANCIKVAKDGDGLKCEVCKTGYYLKEKACEICTATSSTVEAEYTKCKSDTEFLQCKQTIWTIPFKDQPYLVPKVGDTSKKVCTDNTNNCKTMKDSDKTCTACYDGWHVVNGICKQCSAEITNCTKCSVTGTGETAKLVCDTCADNRDSADTKNWYPKEDQSSCLEFPANVMTCSTQKDDTAQLKGCTCKSGYKVQFNTENECERCDDTNCKTCGDKAVEQNDKCTVCNAGYGVVSSKCEICPLNCAKCDSNKEVCTQCNSGFFIVDKYCSPKRDRCTTYDKEGCSVCEYNYYKGPSHCLKCTDLTITTTGGAKNVGAYERLFMVDKCPKVDAKTCMPVAPPTPTPSSGSTTGDVTPTSGTTSGATPTSGSTTTSTTSSSTLYLIAAALSLIILALF